MNTNDTQPPSDSAEANNAGADCPSTSCYGLFICPDGDLHTRKPVESIWIEEIGNWWNRKYRVCLQYKGADTHELEWVKKTRAEAFIVRNSLIAIYHNSQIQVCKALPANPARRKV